MSCLRNAYRVAPVGAELGQPMEAVSENSLRTLEIRCCNSSFVLRRPGRYARTETKTCRSDLAECKPSSPPIWSIIAFVRLSEACEPRPPAGGRRLSEPSSDYVTLPDFTSTSKNGDA